MPAQTLVLRDEEPSQAYLPSQEKRIQFVKQIVSAPQLQSGELSEASRISRLTEQEARNDDVRYLRPRLVPIHHPNSWNAGSTVVDQRLNSA
jgi:hypothetical protein